MPAMFAPLTMAMTRRSSGKALGPGAGGAPLDRVGSPPVVVRAQGPLATGVSDTIRTRRSWNDEGVSDLHR
jgi:hypothetical protein